MNRALNAAAVVLAIAASGCAGISGTPEARKPENAVVRILFATDRNTTSSKTPEGMFGGMRAATLTYGFADVSIPRGHKMGELERPSIWRLEFRTDPAKHFKLHAPEILPADKFFDTLAKRIAASPAQEAFVFVHGYNVTFEDAAMRTAQISYDLAFAGAPVLYSWPSRGSKVSYSVDESTIELTELHLATFLEDFLAKTNAKGVYLIAHSMGSRALTKAIARLHAKNPTATQRLKEIVLAAPDIDAEVFKKDIGPALARTARPITLYASSTDGALSLSKGFHGYPRVGDSGSGLVVVSGVETIDATAVDTSFLGHSYFADRRSVLADMFHLFREGKRADHRFGLKAVDSASGRYWIFRE